MPSPDAPETMAEQTGNIENLRSMLLKANEEAPNEFFEVFLKTLDAKRKELQEAFHKARDEASAESTSESKVVVTGGGWVQEAYELDDEFQEQNMQEDDNHEYNQSTSSSSFALDPDYCLSTAAKLFPTSHLLNPKRNWKPWKQTKKTPPDSSKTVIILPPSRSDLLESDVMNGGSTFTQEYSAQQQELAMEIDENEISFAQ